MRACSGVGLSSRLVPLQAHCRSSAAPVHGLKASQQQMKPQLWLRRTQLLAAAGAQLQHAMGHSVLRCQQQQWQRQQPDAWVRE
jgi:hypothetical protein